MPDGTVVIPIIETTVSRLDSAPQGVALWAEFCKQIIRSTDKGTKFWEFIELNGLVAADEELGISLGGESGAIAV